MYKPNKVEGKDYGDIKLFTLSTCGWCKKTKAFLNDNNIAYSYIDCDNVPDDEIDEVEKEQRKFNSKCSYPTIVINNKDVIVGFDKDKLEKLIGE